MFAKHLCPEVVRRNYCPNVSVVSPSSEAWKSWSHYIIPSTPRGTQLLFLAIKEFFRIQIWVVRMKETPCLECNPNLFMTQFPPLPPGIPGENRTTTTGFLYWFAASDAVLNVWGTYAQNCITSRKIWICHGQWCRIMKTFTHYKKSRKIPSSSKFIVFL